VIDITRPDRVRRCVQHTDDDGETWQVRVEWDAEDGTITEIATELMTSDKANTSQVVKGKGACLVLGFDDLQWLAARLPTIVEHVKKAIQGAKTNGEVL